MTRKILFVQGGGERAHDDWDAKLVDSLALTLGPGYSVRYPRMPQEDEPDYRRWSDALRSEFRGLADGDLLVAHSIGATILLATLAEAAPPFRPGGLFAIAAPFVGEGGWPADQIADMSDLGARLPSDLTMCFYHGDRDDTAPIEHLSRYAAAVPHARTTRLAGRDHQLNDDLSEVGADILAMGGQADGR